MRNSKKDFWVASSSNDWMNEELTLCHVDEVLRRFAFGWQLWYGTPFEFHIMDSVCAKLEEIKFERAGFECPGFLYKVHSGQ